MMKRSTSFLIAISFLVVYSCKTVQTPVESNAKSVLFSVGTKQVFADEFLYMYQKNYSNNPTAFTEASLREYLNLYINFKLKVEEALQTGMDTQPSFRAEFDSYKKQLSRPYLTDREFSEQLVREVYQRMKTELKASHLLVGVSPDAAPEDTLAALKKIQGIRQRIQEGEDFAALAQQLSDDPSARQNKGQLGYFTALQMVYPFEDAAYNTPVGQVSTPVRTRFGYHLIFVEDKRPSRGTVRAAHIMVRASEGIAQQDSIAAHQRILEIKRKLDNGEPWEQLCRQFSEDGSTKDKAGELPPFSARDVPPSFGDVAFSMQNPGQISDPVQTPFGWHIIKLLEKKALAPFEEMKPSLAERIQRDSRSEVTQQQFVEKLKQENKFVENAGLKDSLFQFFDQSLLSNQWLAPEPSAYLSQPVFSIGDTIKTAHNFLLFAERNQREQQGISLKNYVEALYDRFVNIELLAYEEANLALKYPEYRNLLTEYKEGLLLFEIMEQKVWNPAVQDSAGIAAYFESNKDAYQWMERAKAVIVSASTPEILDSVSILLQKGRFPLGNPGEDTLSFEKGQFALSSQQETSLQPLVAFLQQNAKVRLEVNLSRLASEAEEIVQKRADNLLSFFTKAGVAAENIEMVSLGSGSSRPFALAALGLYTTELKALEQAFNTRNALDLQVEEGAFERTQRQVLDLVAWEPGEHRIAHDGRQFLVKIAEIQAPRGKKLEETRGQVISDYQNYLEAQWVSQLKEKYPVVVNEPRLKQMVK